MAQHRPHEEGVIVPRKGKNDPDLGPDAVMAMVPSDLAHLKLRTNARKVPFADGGLYGLYRTGAKATVDMAIAGPFIGAPHAVMGMEKLIALGASRIWVLGWCGSLQSDLRIGNMVIPVWGIPEEGISGHYPLEHGEATSDSRLCRCLENQLKKKGIPFRKGGIWTTDAVYRETPERFDSMASGVYWAWIWKPQP
ncbi:MAG: hypothetical protein U5R49_16075 [Deltaproteobacteria bacterium]|nr:hypothetical protein [Deltaproteobacteria bacterium]